jgi:hypothetical protein
MAAGTTGTGYRTTGPNSRLHLISTRVAYRDHTRALRLRQVLAPAPGYSGCAQTTGMIAMKTTTSGTSSTVSHLSPARG